MYRIFLPYIMESVSLTSSVSKWNETKCYWNVKRLFWGSVGYGNVEDCDIGDTSQYRGLLPRYTNERCPKRQVRHIGQPTDRRNIDLFIDAVGGIHVLLLPRLPGKKCRCLPAGWLGGAAGPRTLCTRALFISWRTYHTKNLPAFPVPVIWQAEWLNYLWQICTITIQ